MWFFSEVSGEVGLILRFAGAIFFVAFAVALLSKEKASFEQSLKEAYSLEAIQYLFLIPIHNPVDNLFKRNPLLSKLFFLS